MKRLIFSMFVVSLLSCEEQAQGVLEEPEALQEASSLDLKSSYRGKYDLVEELYEELIEENPKLEKMEATYKEIQERVLELNSKFKTYNKKSLDYYSSAEYKVAAIKDSLMRDKALQLLHKSQEAYEKRKEKRESSLVTIDQQMELIKDKKQLLKIVLTIPLIETYQSNHLPEEALFDELVKAQKELNKTIDSLLVQ